MLKESGFILLVVFLVLMNGDLPPYIANVLAFLAGLCLKTLPDFVKGTINRKDIIIRLMYIFGLVTMGFLYWQDKKIQIEIFYYVFIVTLFAELIVHLGIKYGAQWINKKAKNLENE